MEKNFLNITPESGNGNQNRVWYQMWIDPGDMLRIELLLEGGSRTWMKELQKYYVFFYERKNGRRILGKDRVKRILDTLL